MFGAGYLEGALTSRRIYQRYVNMYDAVFAGQQFDSYEGGPGIPEVVSQFFSQQEAWLRSMIGSRNFRRPGSDDLYWNHVTLCISQLDGLIQGYNANCKHKQKLTRQALLLLNSLADLLDVLYAKSPNVPRKLFDHIHLPKGTAFVKLVESLTSEGEQLAVGHSTTAPYWDMLRIFKHFKFGFSAQKTASEFQPNQAATFSLSMSSYPGQLASSDDFFVTSSGLVVTSTSLPIFRKVLFTRLKPSQTVLTWMRSLVAVRAATDAGDCVRLLSKFNSGTNNRQWLVTDTTSKLDRTRLAQGGLVWTLDLVPGDSRSVDMTETIGQDGFVFSANRPLSPDVAKQSGLKHYAARYGSSFSTNATARAKILKRELEKAKVLGDLKAILRMSDFESDELAVNNPINAPSQRYDLHPNVTSRRWYGAIDAKITSGDLIQLGMKVLAVSGPSNNEGKVAAFSFIKEPKTNPYAVRSENVTREEEAATNKQPKHWGLSGNFTFPWQILAPTAPIKEATGFDPSPTDP